VLKLLDAVASQNAKYKDVDLKNYFVQPIDVFQIRSALQARNFPRASLIIQTLQTRMTGEKVEDVYLGDLI
jgi:hypothetical protein